MIECDSQSTAETIYHECDGLEYEASGGQLDFRYSIQTYITVSLVILIDLSQRM